MDYLQIVRERLSINFDESDEELMSMIDDAKHRITAWTGKKTFDPFGITTADGLANGMIPEYVRYARSGAADMFRRNYMDLILNLQLEVVKSANPTE